MAPDKTKPRDRIVTVIVGSRAFGTACRRRTIFSRMPFERAVVMKSSPRISISEDRMISEYSAR